MRADCFWGAGGTLDGWESLPALLAAAFSKPAWALLSHHQGGGERAHRDRLQVPLRSDGIVNLSVLREL